MRPPRLTPLGVAVAVGFAFLLLKCGEVGMRTAETAPASVETVVAAETVDSSVVPDPDPDSALAEILAGEVDDRSLTTASKLRATSEWYGVDPRLVARLIRVESGGDPDALGPRIRVRAHGRVVTTRAVGLGQIVPELWLGVFPECGQDLTRIRDNVCHTVLVWKSYRDAHPGDLGRALLAYNGCLSAHCRWYAGAVLGEEM